RCRPHYASRSSPRFWRLMAARIAFSSQMDRPSPASAAALWKASLTSGVQRRLQWIVRPVALRLRPSTAFSPSSSRCFRAFLLGLCLARNFSRAAPQSKSSTSDNSSDIGDAALDRWLVAFGEALDLFPKLIGLITEFLVDFETNLARCHGADVRSAVADHG